MSKKAHVPKSAPVRRAPARDPDGSEPEIQLAYAPAGRETLAAIDAELVPQPLPAVFEGESSSPQITLRESIAGRETIAAILEEARSDGRPEQTTLPYGDRLSNAPGAKTPSMAPSTTPAATQREPAKDASPAPSSPEVFEMCTFVIRGVDPAKLSSEAQRRRFVEERLFERLPVDSMSGVDRVDVTPWTVQGTLVLRVWCRLGSPS